MICNTCGRTIRNEEANFCEYCGASFRGDNGFNIKTTPIPPIPPVSEAVIVENKDKPISFLNWLGTYFLLLFLPYVGLVMLFIWAFGRNVPLSKKNWARAHLVIMLILLVLLTVIFSVVSPEQIFNLMFGDMSQFNNIY